MRSVGRGVVAVSSIALVIAMLPGSVSGRSGEGAHGIGDPYFPYYGNQGYRVASYDIDVAYRPRSHRLLGTTVIRARATQALARFNLDLLLRVSAVRVDGQRAHFRQTPHELIVRPHQVLHRGDRFRVLVEYTGKPGPIRWHGRRPFKIGNRGAVAVGQPHVAAWWFPSNDHPGDKARFEIDLTFPSGREAISNGRFVGRTHHGRTTTWHWRVGRPMATYLAFAAFGDFEVRHGHTGSGRQYFYAVDTSFGRKATRTVWRSLLATERVTEFLESRWGRYPYRQIGGVVTPKFGSALETQTRPVYGPSYFRNLGRPANTAIVSHEMAHQWFGDAVTVRRWRHVWLNEGYATYSNWLWSQHIGNKTVEERFRRNYSRPASSPYWRFPIGDPGPRRLFHDPVYTRGAMTLYALREEIGSRDFFTLARHWIHRNDGVGGQREYRRLAERISGEDLGSFFHRWLYQRSKPRL